MTGRATASIFLLGVVTLACSPAMSVQSPSASEAPRAGGTLRIGVVGDLQRFAELAYSDTSLFTEGLLARCCVARSLLTYPGETTANGGTVLLPDLAEAMPEVAPDGMTWTIKLRKGVHYAPPHEGIEVTSADFVTAVERSLRLNRAEFVFPPYAMVAGVDEFFDGSAPGVEGLLTPDPYTLVIRLSRPVGTLEFLADPSWTPIPASVAEGHDEDFALHWPSTGPYMNSTYPADPAAMAVTLIRNPSWSNAIDPTRRAEPDEIEISLVGDDVEAALARVDAGELDFLHDRLEPQAATRYRFDPQAISRVRSTTSEYLYRLPMNLAVPPFDDLAVRRAVAFALDRVAARDAITANPDVFWQPTPTLLSQHMFADSTTGGLLTAYDPFGLGDGRGNISRARTEMRASRHDTDGDGVCDADVCSSIEMPSFDLDAGAVVAASLSSIGVNVVPVPEGPGNDMGIPESRTAIAVQPFGWGFDLSGTELAVLVKGGEGVKNPDGYAANSSLVGARPEDLASWGYDVTSVPSVDDVIDRCERELGSRRARCWAELDQLLAEEIVPWVPIFALESVWVSSPRVEYYSLDQATSRQFPAFEKVRLVAGSE